jgi:uncharacterized protein (DUF4213/DUF364 family)
MRDTENERRAEDPFVRQLLEALPAEAHAARLLDVRVGPFWTVVWTSRGAGMASTLSREALPHGHFPVAGAGSLHERSPFELAELALSTSVTEASVGLAAINGLSSPPEGFEDGNAEDIIRSRGAGRRVAMIGRFPFVRRVRPQCDELWVFERGSARRPGDYGAADMPELLPQADVVAVTATTLVNHTLAEVLALVRADAFTLMLGPSTPLSPVVLDRFDVLCGSVVVDAEAVVREASQGAVTRQIRGVRRVNLWADGG